jgi:hypothetical protein
VTQPRRAAGDVSAGYMFFLCLALFLIAVVNVPSIWLTDEELEEPFWKIALLVGFWGGIAGTIYFGRQWRLERRVARGEPAEKMTADQAFHEEVIALSHWTDIRAGKIVRDLKARGMTTREWAAEHDIDTSNWRTPQ